MSHRSHLADACRFRFIINDTYRSDLCLLYPPHLIAVAAVYIAFSINPPPKKTAQPALKTSASIPSPSTTGSDNSTAKSNPPSSAPSPTTAPSSSSNIPQRPAPSAGNPKLLHPSLPAKPTFDAFPSSNSGRLSPQPSRPSSTAPPPQPSTNPSVSASSAAPMTAQPPSKRDPVTFLAELNVPLKVVLEITQDIISLYSLWHAFEEGPSATGGAAASPGRPGGPSASMAAQMLTAGARGSVTATGSSPQKAYPSNPSATGSTPTPATSGQGPPKISPDERIIKILARMRDARSMEQVGKGKT